jgi:DNA-binding transcriptional MerR regulator
MFTDEQLDRLITIHNCRDLGFCLEGSKQQIESLGLNFKQVMKTGILVRDAIPLNNALVNRLIEHVTKEG